MNEKSGLVHVNCSFCCPRSKPVPIYTLVHCAVRLRFGGNWAPAINEQSSISVAHSKLAESIDAVLYTNIILCLGSLKFLKRDSYHYGASSSFSPCRQGQESNGLGVGIFGAISSNVSVLMFHRFPYCQNTYNAVDLMVYIQSP